MKTKVNLKERRVSDNQYVRSPIERALHKPDLSVSSPVDEITTYEGGESFFNYLDWLGLAEEPDSIVLSSMHHYYYDVEDLKSIKTVVNLMPLNQISDIKAFLESISHLLSAKCYFTGCFSENLRFKFFKPKEYNDLDKESIDNNILSRIPLVNLIYNFIDMRPDRFLSRNKVKFMLLKHGFKILDMTEINGLTYFCARKLPSAENQ